MFWLWTFLIYWLLFFVACTIVVEVGQKHFYDEVTPFAWLKVGGSTAALAAALTWWDPSSVDLFTSEIWLTAMVGVVGFVLFVLVIRFHAPHALMLGPVTVVFVAITAAMAVDSLKNSGRANLRDRPIPAEQRTIRKSASSSIGVLPEEPAPEAAGGSPASKATTAAPSP